MKLKRSAEKEFSRLPRQVQERFAPVLERLKEEATRARPGADVKRLEGTTNGWRLRVGDHRGIYEVEGDVVTFTRFGHRSKIYAP